MKRAAKPVSIYADARGVPLVSIKPALKRSFARACLITMTQRDGIERGWMMRCNSIDVPSDIVEETRLRLSRGGQMEEGSNE